MVKEDFLNFYPFLNTEKIVVAPEGVDPDFTKDTTKEYEEQVLEKLGVKGDFLLYVSSMYRHKNVENLIDAFVVLKKKYGYKGQLILIGKKDYFSERVGEYVKEIGGEIGGKDILMPGLENYVEDSEIVALRKRAQLYVFPSLQEGFSLTPLEGMIWNLPAVISDIPCHKEVYGDSVEYFDPNDVENIAETINKVLKNGDLQEELRKKGRERVKMFDWNKTAEITYRIFGEVLSR